MSEPKTKEVSIQENKMGIMPVPRLLITMSLPMMISMLVQALYNIVDSMFVAKLSEDALTAVSLAFPIQTLMIAIASGTGGDGDHQRLDGKCQGYRGQRVFTQFGYEHTVNDII